MLTLEILALGLPTMVVLKQMDVAASMNILIDSEALARELGCPVIGLPDVKGENLERIMEWIDLPIKGDFKIDPLQLE